MRRFCRDHKLHVSVVTPTISPSLCSGSGPILIANTFDGVPDNVRLARAVVSGEAGWAVCPGELAQASTQENNCSRPASWASNRNANDLPEQVAELFRRPACHCSDSLSYILTTTQPTSNCRERCTLIKTKDHGKGATLTVHFVISATWGPTDPTRAMLPFLFAASVCAGWR